MSCRNDQYVVRAHYAEVLESVIADGEDVVPHRVRAGLWRPSASPQGDGYWLRCMTDEHDSALMMMVFSSRIANTTTVNESLDGCVISW
ncbi:hypothetical protein [Propionibacterium sp. oral taxon 192]|uniref:hypothetical protein n=1 Tax=Propionibacterium sp. oral taxon 192 TaxID=671222 RepID=UPI0012EB0982|nr:hypothetical protein [Propionibacterium sp. oral taxon 192]